MNFKISRRSKVASYGILTEQGSFYTEQSIIYGSNIVAGIQPQKGGKKHLGVEVYNTLSEALLNTEIEICMIHGSKGMAVEAIKESIELGIPFIICLVGGIPSLDMIEINEMLSSSQSTLLGPSSLGILIPNECKLGVIPEKIAKRGNVGLITRHGSLTFEILHQLSENGLGLSIAISLGSEVIKGMDLISTYKYLQRDKNTETILILGNISGFDEERFSLYYQRLNIKNKKPVLIYMAGSYYNFKGKTTYNEQVKGEQYLDTKGKQELLSQAGIEVIASPSIISARVKEVQAKTRKYKFY